VLTVRLPKETEEQLNNLAKQYNLTKTELVKKAISEYLSKFYKNPYETGKDLFGSDESEIEDGSSTYKERVRSYLGEKHSH